MNTFLQGKLLRKLILLAISGLLLMAHFSYAECGYFIYSAPCEKEPPYCEGVVCSLEKGVSAVGEALKGLISTKSLSVYTQDIVTYLLSFISIVAVIYIIYAGFQVMTGAGDEEKLKKAKNIILYVILGIIIMWLAYGIVGWALKLIKP